MSGRPGRRAAALHDPATVRKFGSLCHPKLYPPTARSAEPEPTPRYCTRCMSPHTPPTVALTGYQRDLQHRLDVGARRRQPFVERPTALEIESARGMIARFDAIEQLAADSLAARRINAADQPATGRQRPTISLAAALATWEIQAHRTLANHPDPADLVRVARVQALIATTTVVISEAAARRGEIDAEVIDRLTAALENAQLA